MLVQFHKMHGLGNDFILIDNRHQQFKTNPVLLRQLANRHTGIGCDQFLILEAPTSDTAYLNFRIFNADGSEAEQCGNGMRCITLFLGLQGEISSTDFTINGAAGDIICRWRMDDPINQASINMGEPKLSAAEIPMDCNYLQALDNGRWRLESDKLKIQFSAVSMGNPHAIVLADEHPDLSLEQLSALLSQHPAFPSGVNIGLVENYSANSVQLRVFERGSGLTQACGSGACAAMAALRLTGKIDHSVSVHQPGGELVVNWYGSEDVSVSERNLEGNLAHTNRSNNNDLWMTGPASYVFKGEFRDEYKR